MTTPKRTALVHRLRVRTAVGDVWTVGVQPIRSLELALKVAHALRMFLRGDDPAAQREAPPFATALRDALNADGADLAGCVVTVCRGDSRRAMVSLPVRAPEPPKHRPRRPKAMGTKPHATTPKQGPHFARRAG